MSYRYRTAALLTAAATLLVAVVALAAGSEPAAAHGAAMVPGSRTFLCWKDGLTPTGEIQPNNPACSAAVAQSGANSLYTWFSVLRSDAEPDHATDTRRGLHGGLQGDQLVAGRLPG